MRRKERKKEETEAPAKWLSCAGCHAIGSAGSFCGNCEDTGMIYSEKCDFKRGTPWDSRRRLWMSRVGLMWRDGFKKKEQETLFKGMKVMILKGPADRLFQVGMIVNVMSRYLEVEYYNERDARLYRQRVHMHSILVIHRGAKVTVDQNGVLFVERRSDKEIRTGVANVSDDEVSSDEN
jgi:hypothetical protein